jgi:hypothetical protein
MSVGCTIRIINYGNKPRSGLITTREDSAMCKVFILCAAVLAMFPLAAGATDPGTPMNCSDLLLSPGLICSEFSNPGEGGRFRQNDALVDNDGNILEQGDGSNRDIIDEMGMCGDSRLFNFGLLWQVNEGGGRTPIASVQSRCLDLTTSTVEGLRSASIVFDSVNGVLVVVMNSICGSRGGTLCDNYNGGSWIARISGFTPLATALPEAPLAATLCNNGIDDDEDGLIDLDDQQCKSTADNDESRP